MRASWELVAAAQQGDRHAFGVLYSRYVDTVFGYVLARVADRGLAEDLTSEVFLRAWRRIDSVTDQGKDPSAWLVTIARNLIIDQVTSSRCRREVVTADVAAVSDRARGTQAAGSSVERAVIETETAAEVRGHLARLTAEQAQCVRLRFLTGRSVAETATAMGRTAGAVAALQHRALRNLATVASAADRGTMPVPWIAQSRAAGAPGRDGHPALAGGRS